MAIQVVVTRPLAQALPLAQRINDIGCEAVVFPLLDIQSLADLAPLKTALAELDRYAMVAFVSPNAIDAAFAMLPRWPSDVTIAVMGEGSRAALAAHGVTGENATIVSPLDPHRTDSQTLFKALDLRQLNGKRVLILRGQNGRELLADALRGAGVDVVQVAAYRRVAVELDETRRAQLSQSLDADNIWILTSSEALHVLIKLVEQIAGQTGVAKMQQKTLIMPHARIAETARALGFVNITLTGSGDERLLAALQFGT